MTIPHELAFSFSRTNPLRTIGDTGYIDQAGEMSDYRTIRSDCRFHGGSVARGIQFMSLELAINPISLTCPFCHAKPQRDCVTASGGSSHIHIARIRAAARQYVANERDRERIAGPPAVSGRG